jgi:hypothetical protein
MMQSLTHLLALIFGLSLAVQITNARADEDEVPAPPPPQNCPEIRGRYSCHDSFLLSYSKGHSTEMRVEHSKQEGYPLFLFSAADGENGFWAVGDGAPHAYIAESGQAWGFREIDSEASCPDPHSLDIRYLLQDAHRTRGKTARHRLKLTASGAEAIQDASHSGYLHFEKIGEKRVRVTSRVFAPRGDHHHATRITSTVCERVEE